MFRKLKHLMEQPQSSVESTFRFWLWEIFICYQQSHYISPTHTCTYIQHKSVPSRPITNCTCNTTLNTSLKITEKLHKLINTGEWIIKITKENCDYNLQRHSVVSHRMTTFVNITFSWEADHHTDSINVQMQVCFQQSRWEAWWSW